MSVPMPVITTNLLLGLVAFVAVASTVLSYFALLWATRRRTGLPGGGGQTDSKIFV